MSRCISLTLLLLIPINVKAFDYDRSFLAEVKPQISEQCYKDLIKGDKILREFIVQAVSVWNAKTPGLLNGSHDYVGNYAECLNSDRSPVVMRYCVLDVAVTYEGETPIPCNKRALLGFKPCASNDDISPGHILKWALCATDSCSESNLEVMADILLQQSDIGKANLPFKVSLPENSCQTSAKTPFRSGTIAFFLLAGIIAAIVIICTVWHWSILRMAACNPAIEAPVLIRNWSAIQHLSTLIAPPQPRDIQLFHCIKVMSLLSTVFLHELLFTISGPMANLNFIFTVMSDARFIRVDLLVDTFFTITGFIIANNYAALNDISLTRLIIGRYFRIVPVFALVLFYVSSVMEYTAAGPFWPLIVNPERDTCQKNWGQSLLMVGNYGKLSEYCCPTFWYLPSDFHFFILGVLLCRLFKKNGKLGVAAISSVLVAAIGYSGAYIALNNELVLMPKADDSIRKIRESPTWVLYIQSHFRISSYLVGMLGGYTTHVVTEKKIKMSQATARIGFLLSGAVIGLVFISKMIYGSEVPYSATRAALYGSLVRPAWSLGLVLFTLVVVLSKNTAVTAFTEMKIWAPLSKLTFGVYLLQFVIIFQRIGNQMQPLVFTYSGLIIDALVDIIKILLLSLVMHICVEKPFHGLGVMMLSKRSKMTKPKHQ